MTQSASSVGTLDNIGDDGSDQIIVKAVHEEDANAIASKYSVPPFLARVLAARGFEPGAKLDNYLEPALKVGLPQPSELLNLDEACDLIESAINNDQMIAICCDYDVDGLTAGAQLFHFLKSINARVDVFVPDRFVDGYGLSTKMVADIADQGFNLLITLDYGTTNITELKLARSRGLKTVVVDHHKVPDELPEADFIVNPQQNGCGFADGLLSAAGLAWYLVARLIRRIDRAKHVDAREYLDLACLGTICDLVPLIGPNRVIAKKGLQYLGETRRVGLRALKNLIGLNGTMRCYEVSFLIGPRINAAGRMANADIVLQLLTTDDSRLAYRLARQLNKLNEKRQKVEELIRKRAIDKINALSVVPPALVVADSDFHTGVIGIVAQRLTEYFKVPSVVLGMDEEGVFKGSVRGVKGFNVVAALSACGKYLTKFGGHEGAGGLSLAASNLDDFEKAFHEYSNAWQNSSGYRHSLEVDAEAELGEFNIEAVRRIGILEPFGIGNPTPAFLLRSLTVVDLKILKDAHLKVELCDSSGRKASALMWRRTEHPVLKKGNVVDIGCKAGINNFRNNAELQLTILGARIAQ